MKTIFFDVDGTLYDGYLVTDFNTFMAIEGYTDTDVIDKEKQLLADYKTGAIDYREAARRVLQLHADILKGRTIEEVQQVQVAFAQKHSKLFPWVVPLIDKLKRREVDIHLISASSTIALEVIAATLGVKSYHGTELEVAGDRYTSKLSNILNYEAKHMCIQTLLGRHPNDMHIGVGDSLGDVDMLQAMDISIVYNPQADELEQIAREHGWLIGRQDTMQQVVLTAVDTPEPPTINRLA
jgi:HAD superfamily phosphoserine phosphatase-like hydrolase